ncbi:MAG: type IV pilus assembly protein PilM [Actinomycetes bacterium]
MAGRSAIGLDIGTSGVRAAEVSVSKGRLTLERFGQVALPEGAVSDGEVIDQPAVAKAIKELWAHTRFSSKKVVLGVANQKVVVRQVDLPWLPPDELKAGLAFQVQDYLPMPVDEAVLDFYVLDEITDTAGARLLRGLLVAAVREMVLSSVQAVRKAGLRPTMVDLTSFAVLRSLAPRDELGMTTGVEAIVDVGARVTNIVIHEAGVPRFVRILLLGGQDVTEAVATRMGVPITQAETLKQEQSREGAELTVGLAPVSRVVEAASAPLIDEVRGSLDYYRASTGAAPITRLVLSGGGALLAGLGERLAAATRIPIAAGNPFQPLSLGRTGLAPEQLDFVQPLAAVPVGLALGALS